jgi:hypothetical protein
MNQRIDQLWAQALDAAVPETYTRLSHSQVLKIKQVFADMIVRECVQSIEKTIEVNCAIDDEKMGCEFAITDLLEHFGVES